MSASGRRNSAWARKGADIMTRTQHQNARNSARAIAKEQGVTYQQALDIVAQKAGHPHWAAMKSAMEIRKETALNILDSIVEGAWKRRSEKIILIMGDKITTVFLKRGDHTNVGIGLDVEETDKLKRHLLNHCSIDVADEMKGSWSGVRYPVILSGRQYGLPISISGKNGKREIEIHLPSFEERVAVESPLNSQAMKKIKNILYNCDHGLTVICNRTKSERIRAAEHLLQEIPDVGNVGIFEEDEIDEAIDHSHGWHAILLLNEPSLTQSIEKLDKLDDNIRHIAGINLEKEPPMIIAYE